MKKHLTKNNLIYLLIFILFLSTVIIIASYHEYWSDEAQAWLLARDASIIDLITKYLKFEGHPILWYLVIKIFINLGGSYNNFNLVSTFFVSLGVLILLFKIKCPLYLKVLLPFTFFIYYQFSAIARGYCLIVFLLFLLIAIWDKREKYYYFFTFILILLINTELYTYLLAGSIYLLEIYDFLKNKEYKNTKKLVSFIILFFSFLLTLIYIYPDVNVMRPINELTFRISKSLFLPFNFSDTISLIIDFLLIVFLLLNLLKEGKEKLIKVLVLILPIILFMLIFYFNIWHYGVLFLIMIFITIVYKLYENKQIKILIIITCLVQILFNINSSISEIKYTYQPSEEMANFIKKYDYKNLKIYAYKFDPVLINPYFKKNIFDNWSLDKGFFSYDRRNKSYYEQTNNMEYDIVIRIETKKEKSFIFDKKKYNKYVFKGDLIFQVVSKERYVFEVYIKKDIKQIDSDINKEFLKVCY